MGSLREYWRKAPLLMTFVAGWVALSVVAGIVGNRADAAFLKLIPTVQNLLFPPNWRSLAVILPAMLIGGWLFTLTRSRQVVEKLNRLLELHDSLLRLLPAMTTASDLGEAIKKIIDELLRDATKLFDGKVTRAYVLRPDEDHLRGWVGYQMPDSNMNHPFYIGPDRNIARGAVGHAYLAQEIRVVTFSKRNGKMEPNEGSDYHCFDPDRPYLPYQSFVSIPLIWGDARVGMLCFDSQDPDVFSSRTLQDELLRPLGRAFASAIVTYDRLLTNRSKG